MTIRFLPLKKNDSVVVQLRFLTSRLEYFDDHVSYPMAICFLCFSSHEKNFSMSCPTSGDKVIS